MTSEQVGKLGDLLRSIDDQPWNYSVYLPARQDWNENTPYIIADPDQLDESETEPLLARKSGLQYALGVGATQDVIINAKEQKPGATLPELIAALRYYFDNDAFMKL